MCATSVVHWQPPGSFWAAAGAQQTSCRSFKLAFTVLWPIGSCPLTAATTKVLYLTQRNPPYIHIHPTLSSFIFHTVCNGPVLFLPGRHFLAACTTSSFCPLRALWVHRLHFVHMLLRCCCCCRWTVPEVHRSHSHPCRPSQDCSGPGVCRPDSQLHAGGLAGGCWVPVGASGCQWVPVGGLPVFC